MKKEENSDFTHIDEEGNPRMVNVADKKESKRIAIAQSIVELGQEVMSLMKDDEIQGKKGPVMQTAIIAGIMGAKKCHELIPMCHPLSLEHCSIKINSFDENAIKILCEVHATGKTGVEMEALTGANIAALTVYDMCKSYSKSIKILDIRLIMKSGGKSDYQDENS